MMTKRFVLFLSCAMLVTACSTAKKELGLGRQSPDEFSIVERAPLTLPPDYTLRPPRTGGDTDYLSAQAQAKRVVLGSEADNAAAPAASSATEALLQQAGASNPQPNIRAAVDKESAVISTQNRTVAEKLLFWDKEGSLPAEERLNPTDESARLNKSGIVAPTPGQMRSTPTTTTTAQ